MFTRILTPLYVLALFTGALRAEEYKTATVTKVEVTGEMTLEYLVAKEKKNVKVWPYDDMKCYDEKGERILAAIISKVGTVLDVKTSKDIMKGFEIITEATIVKRPKGAKK